MENFQFLATSLIHMSKLLLGQVIGLIFNSKHPDSRETLPLFTNMFNIFKMLL